MRVSKLSQVKFAVLFVVCLAILPSVTDAVTKADAWDSMTEILERQIEIREELEKAQSSLDRYAGEYAGMKGDIGKLEIRRATLEREIELNSQIAGDRDGWIFSLLYDNTDDAKDELKVVKRKIETLENLLPLHNELVAYWQAIVDDLQAELEELECELAYIQGDLYYDWDDYPLP